VTGREFDTYSPSISLFTDNIITSTEIISVSSFSKPSFCRYVKHISSQITNISHSQAKIAVDSMNGANPMELVSSFSKPSIDNLIQTYAMILVDSMNGVSSFSKPSIDILIQTYATTILVDARPVKGLYRRYGPYRPVNISGPLLKARLVMYSFFDTGYPIHDLSRPVNEMHGP